MSNFSEIQKANALYVEFHTEKKATIHELDKHPAFRGDDADQVAYRVRNTYAHQELDYLELSTSQRPFDPSWHDRKHKQWRKARLHKAIDQAIEKGLIKPLDKAETRFRYTGPK